MEISEIGEKNKTAVTARKSTSKRSAKILKEQQRPPLSKMELVANIPFFKALSQNDISHIEPYFQEYKFKKNHYLFWEHDSADRVYVIKSGRVKLLKTAATGKKMVLEVMAPGQICGGATLFSDFHFNSAQAVETTDAYGLSREDFYEILDKYPEITRGIIKFLGTKLMDSHDVIISLASSKVESRIAAVITRLCENHGTQTSEGILINIRLARQDIADIVGSTVETTVRIISKFQKEGLLATISGQLLVRDPDAFIKMMKTGV